MPYITIEDVRELGADEEFLKKAVDKAIQLFDAATMRFYAARDFESDVEWRKKAVKDALKAQVEYFIEQGATTAHELNSEPISVHLGRTTVSRAAKNRSVATNASSTSNLLCDEFYLLLSGTGLLYRGVRHG